MAEEREQKNDKGKGKPKVVSSRAYVNFALIRHTGEQFVIDFGERHFEDPNRIQMLAGVKMSPEHAKALLKALYENIKKYENKIGKIPWPPGAPGDTDLDWFFEKGKRG